MALAKKLKAARKTKRMTIAEILGGDSTKNKRVTSSRTSEGDGEDPEDEGTPVPEDDIKVNPWVVPEMVDNPNEP